MAQHHEETRLFQMEIGIRVDDGVVAYLHTAFVVFLWIQSGVNTASE